jgi:Uma2 family endonuclease
MAAAPDSPLVTLEEYLNTSYDPDVEFVDGMLVERHMGDWLHSLIQSNLIFALRRKYPHLKVVPELRSRITETRYRIPDVTVLLAPPATKYLLDHAFIAIEILSEEDVMSRLTVKLKEYAAKGVPNIWVLDPREKLMWAYRPPALVEIEGDTIATGDGAIELSRVEIFAE